MGGTVLKSLYGTQSLAAAKIGIVIEGEFDCLLLQQEIGDLAGVVTMGSATSYPGPRWRLHLAHLHHLLVMLDPDEAGAKGQSVWQKLFPRVQTLPITFPSGQDVTDYWQAGGDLRAWVKTAVDTLMS